MRNVSRLLVATLLGSLLVLGSFLPASGALWAFGPASGIEIVDAIGGRDYQGLFFVKYGSEGEGSVTLKLSASGDIADWVTFHGMSGSGAPFETISLTAGKLTYISANFYVPRQTPNGVASGELKFEVAPPTSEGEGTAVGFRGHVKVEIHIVGSEEGEEPTPTPGVVPTATPVDASPAATGTTTATPTDEPLGATTPSPTATPISDSETSGTSTGMIVGIIVGVVGIALVIVAVVRRRA